LGAHRLHGTVAAGLLVAEPALLLTVTVYAPAFADCALATV
jgi:hypothetical protein